MTTLLDQPSVTGHPVLTGVAEIHDVLDRMNLATHLPLAPGDHAALVSELDRAARRIVALKLRMVAAVDRAGAATDAGFTDTGAWVARHTLVSRSSAAGEVALATELDAGHDATAAALDQGLVSPAHAGGDRERVSVSCRARSATPNANTSRPGWWRRRNGSTPTS